MFVQLSLQTEHFSSIGAWRSPIAMAMDGLGFDGGWGDDEVLGVFRGSVLLLFLFLFLFLFLEMSEVELSGSDAKIEGRSPFLEVRLRLKHM